MESYAYRGKFLILIVRVPAQTHDHWKNSEISFAKCTHWLRPLMILMDASKPVVYTSLSDGGDRSKRIIGKVRCNVEQCTFTAAIPRLKSIP